MFGLSTVLFRWETRLGEKLREGNSDGKEEFEAFPPRQKPSSFSIDEALEKARQNEQQLAKASGGGVK
jgi:hypothetical protein